MKAILFDNGIEIKRGKYPRKDMKPIIGLAAGLEWKIVVTNTIPAFDVRTHKVSQAIDNSDDYHPVYTHLKQYKLTYSIVTRTKTYIIRQLRQVEDEKNLEILGVNERQKLLLLGIGILIRKSNGVNITNKEETILARILNKATNVWQNDAELKSKIQKVNNNNDPSIDSDWNTEE